MFLEETGMCSGLPKQQEDKTRNVERKKIEIVKGEREREDREKHGKTYSSCDFGVISTLVCYTELNEITLNRK